MFPFHLDNSIGLPSWDWPQMPPCKQKLVEPSKWDPGEEFFNMGSHNPQLCFFGESKKARRTPERRLARAKAADARGWGPEARQRKQRKDLQMKGTVEGEDSTRGGGEKGEDSTPGGGEATSGASSNVWSSRWSSGWHSDWSGHW